MKRGAVWRTLPHNHANQRRGRGYGRAAGPAVLATDLLVHVPAVPVNDTMAPFLEGDSDSARVVGGGGREGGRQIKGREWAVEKRKAKQNEKQQTRRLSEGGGESTASGRK